MEHTTIIMCHTPEKPVDEARRSRISMLALGLLALALYGPMISWGVPHATAPDRTRPFSVDDILPLEPLAEMHNTFVISKPDRNYGYPWWHYFVVAVTYTPYIGYLKLTGGIVTPMPEFPFGLHDPVTSLKWLTLIGRSVTLVMAAGTVMAAYYCSKMLWGSLAGVIAAVLTLLNYLMWYYSRTGNLEVPAFFWSSIGCAIFTTILVQGLTARRVGWLGLFAGLAMATKDQTVVFFLPFALLLTLPRFNHALGEPYQGKAVLYGLGAFVLAYLIGTGMVLDPQRHLTHVHALFFDPRRVSNAGFYRPPYPQTWQGTIELVQSYLLTLGAGLSWPVLFAALGGAIVAWRTAPSRLVLCLPVLTLFLLLALPTRYAILRYVLPLTLVVDSFAALLIVRLRHSRLRLAWLPLLLLLGGWRLLIGLDLTYAQYYETRTAASRWFNTHARLGERVAYFGITQQLPHLPASIQASRIADHPRWKGILNHESEVFKDLATTRPENVVIIPDAYSQPGMERSGDCPPAVYEALVSNATAYRFVMFFPTPELFPGLLQRPFLDYPAVAPPVRIFAREDIAARLTPTTGRF